MVILNAVQALSMLVFKFTLSRQTSSYEYFKKPKQQIASLSSMLAKIQLMLHEPTSVLDFYHMQRTSEFISCMQKTTLIIKYDLELVYWYALKFVS